MLMQPNPTERYLQNGIYQDFPIDNELNELRSNVSSVNSMLEVVSRIYRPGMQLLKDREEGLKVMHKDDGTPVTNADIRMSNELTEILTSITDVPVVSEEHTQAIDNLTINRETSWWLIDPIDGTKSFVEGYPGFAVCVSLMKGREPEIGVIMFPQLKSVYFASKGAGSFKLALDSLKLIQLDSLKNRTKAPTIATFFHPRPENGSKMDHFAARHGVDPQSVKKVSAALKYCELAEGKFSYGGGWSPLQLWDIAAADLIVTESGGRFRDPDTGQKIIYDPRALSVPRSIAIAAGRRLEPFDSNDTL